MNKAARGKYIVFNGIEGSGKDTQIVRIAEALRSFGIPVHVTREPGGTNVTAKHIRRLTQDPQFPMDTTTETLLYNASRSQSLADIRQLLDRGVWVLSNYNYIATIVFQGYGRNAANIETIRQLCEIAVGDMVEDLNIVLDIPAEIAAARKKAYSGGERFDSVDTGWLQRCREGFLLEAQSKGLTVVNGNQDIEKVSFDIWEAIRPLMSGQATQDREATPASDKPEHSQASDTYLEKLENESYQITLAGKKKLASIVSNADSDVYGFTAEANPVTVAAAMARLSRRGDDMRVTLLDEFSDSDAQKDQALLSRVISAYGDDSVQQLVGQHIVVENASQLLTKKLEWGRLASYLEQSTRYIYYDQKTTKGRYRYHTPAGLDEVTTALYEKTLDEIFSGYSIMVRKLTSFIGQQSKTPPTEQDAAWRSAVRAQACDAARAVLPVATTSTVGVYASAQALESLYMHLAADELPEARIAGERILHEARKTIPMFLERADKPERGGARIAHMANTKKTVRERAKSLLPDTLAPEGKAVTLVDYFPRNELDLVAHILYEHSDRSLPELQSFVSDLPYSEKSAILRAYMGERLNRRHKPGRAFEVAHYTWDIVCDYGIFRDLQRHRMVDALEWQALSPRYGYDMPEIIDQAGLGDVFENCFDKSLELYSTLQAAGYSEESQYATLLGHKMRWKVTYNAREAIHLHELRTAPQGHPGYRKLVQEMHEKLCEVHPMIGESMVFVNRDEDPELTRLAAERYTQMKLQAQSN